MRKRIIVAVIVVTILSLVTTLYAKPQIKKRSIDREVSQIETTYNSISDMTANFSQKTDVTVLGKTMLNAGTMSWKKPGNFFINYTGDRPKQYISNGKKMWIFVPGDTQVEIYKVSGKTISKEALEFMRGFVDIKRNYNIVSIKNEGEKTVLSLVPLFGNAPYSKLNCTFRSDNLLEKVTIFNISGNISTYTFSNIQVNPGLSEKLFTFKKPQGVKEVHIK